MATLLEDRLPWCARPRGAGRPAVRLVRRGLPDVRQLQQPGGKGVGHLWRSTGDISDRWDSLLKLTKLNLVLADHAGPGHWNDPDMLEVGNGGMTVTEYRTHFALWAIMAAPLLIGCDLRRISPENLEILLNTDVIAIDQDPLGELGLESAGPAKDLWTGDRIEVGNGGLGTSVPAHGTAIYRISAR